MPPFRASAGFTDRWKHFAFTVDDGVATLTFQRPENANLFCGTLSGSA